MPEERLISNASGGQLVFKSVPLRPKLESLSLCQWSRANLSIMYKLLSTGELTQTQALDYLSYTMRFYHLVSSCEFVSVLFFDREYRRLQKQHSFRWGTDIPHLQSVYLRPKTVYNKPQASGPLFKNANKQQQDYSRFTSHSIEGNEIWKNFNGRKGCSFPNCRYLRICAIQGCGAQHQAFAHPKNG